MCSFDVFRQVGLQATAANHRAVGIGSAYTYNPAADLGPGTSVVAEFYFPSVAERITTVWSRKLASRIDMRISGPNTQLMMSDRWQQRHRTGGAEATSPPPLEQSRVVRLKPTAIQQEAIDDPSFYPQPEFMLDISFGDKKADTQDQQAQIAPLGGVAGQHDTDAVPLYAADERPSVTYVLDFGTPQRLHKPGFYPSPFAVPPEPFAGPTQTPAQQAAPAVIPPTYHTAGPAAMLGGMVGSPTQTVNPLVAPVPTHVPAVSFAVPFAPHPLPDVAIGKHAYDPLNPRPADATPPKSSAYPHPDALGAYQDALYTAAHAAPHSPAHSSQPVPSAPDPPPYPTAVDLEAYSTNGYPDPLEPAPPYEVVPPSYHYDHQPAV